MRTTIVVMVLRFLIGWHFLYEGLAKLVQPGGWSAAGYLRMSKWFAAPLFHHIADTPALLRACDLLNMWGLTLIGLALILGVLVRPAAICGVLLLAFYYIAQPPFLAWAAEGHFLWIDRNVVEAAALAVIALLPSADLGAWVVARLRARRGPAADAATAALPPASQGRRELLLRLGSLPVLGAFGFAFLRKHGPVWERENLKDRVDTVTTATVKAFDFADIKDLKKPDRKSVV